MGLYDYTIYSIIKRNARVSTNRICLISGTQRVTFAQFQEKVDRLSCGLLDAGLKRGDRIGVLGHNSPEYLYLYGAAAKAGAIMIPINWRLDPDEIKYVISDGTPKMLFVGSEFQEMMKGLIPKFDFVEKSYALDQANGSFEAFNDLMGRKGFCPHVDICSDDGYVIIYTAAVGGKPRGVVLSHKNLIASNAQTMYHLALTPHDVHLLVLPLFHIAGLGTALSVLQSGGTNVVLPGFDVDSALQHIKDDRISVFGTFPPMLKTLMESAQAVNADLSSIRHVFGLENPDIIRKFQEMSGATFWTAYGQSEISGLISFSPYFERPGSAGVPSFLVEVGIVDDHGNMLEADKPGEIVVKGPMVFSGYWNLPEDNAYTFRGGWHHTGDLGYFDTDGYLWYSGRSPEKELIKPGGENVYPAEVEKAILEHPAIEDVVVIGVPDSKWGEAIKAVCVKKKDASLEEAELIEFVADRIARYKKPKYIVFTSSFPRNEDGFIVREKVKEEYLKF